MGEGRRTVGRPRRKEEALSTERIVILVTPEERELIRELAMEGERDSHAVRRVILRLAHEAAKK